MAPCQKSLKWFALHVNLYTLAPLHVHFPLKIIVDVSMICIAKKETKKLTKSMQNMNEVVILAFFLQEEMTNGLHISCSTLYTLNTNVKTIVNDNQQTFHWLCHHGIKPILIGTSCFCSHDFVLSSNKFSPFCS